MKAEGSLQNSEQEYPLLRLDQIIFTLQKVGVVYGCTIH